MKDTLKNNIRKSYTQVNETNYLIPLSRRHPLFYVEHCKIVRKDNDVRIITQKFDEEMSHSLPVGNIGALLIGPGFSITTEAARIITSRGCLLSFTGGGLVPLFLISSQHRSPISRIRQYKISFNDESRLIAGKILFDRRRALIEKFKEFELPDFPDVSNILSIEQLNLTEAAWAKRAYRKLAKDFDIPWTNKDNEDKNHKNPITFLNFLSYSIADIAIYHLGYDPNIGILHGRTKGGGLAYDLADIIKPIVALVPSFVARYKSLKLAQIKSNFISDIIHYDLIDYLIKTLEMIFNKKEEKEINNYVSDIQ